VERAIPLEAPTNRSCCPAGRQSSLHRISVQQQPSPGTLLCIRKTLPVTVSSPVMAIVGSTLWSNASDGSDVAIVTPAEGPEVTSCVSIIYFFPVAETQDGRTEWGQSGCTYHL
jgi:hypothetical protein